MQQTFTVETVEDHAQEVVEITIRCSPNLIQTGLEVARMQVATIGDPRPQPAPEPPRQLEAPDPGIHDFMDAQWRERASGPVLPNTGGRF